LSFRCRADRLPIQSLPDVLLDLALYIAVRSFPRSAIFSPAQLKRERHEEAEDHPESYLQHDQRTH
jgi:hypothetical protein